MNVSDAARVFHLSRRKVQVKCAICGKEVLGYTWRKYCGRKCASHAAYLKRKERLNGK